MENIVFRNVLAKDRYRASYASIFRSYDDAKVSPVVRQTGQLAIRLAGPGYQYTEETH